MKKIITFVLITFFTFGMAYALEIDNSAIPKDRAEVEGNFNLNFNIEKIYDADTGRDVNANTVNLAVCLKIVNNSSEYVQLLQQYSYDNFDVTLFSQSTPEFTITDRLRFFNTDYFGVEPHQSLVSNSIVIPLPDGIRLQEGKYKAKVKIRIQRTYQGAFPTADCIMEGVFLVKPGRLLP